jgi:hypothetical protein
MNWARTRRHSITKQPRAGWAAERVVYTNRRARACLLRSGAERRELEAPGPQYTRRPVAWSTQVPIQRSSKSPIACSNFERSVKPSGRTPQDRSNRIICLTRNLPCLYKAYPFLYPGSFCVAPNASLGIHLGVIWALFCNESPRRLAPFHLSREDCMTNTKNPDRPTAQPVNKVLRPTGMTRRCGSLRPPSGA